MGKQKLDEFKEEAERLQVMMCCKINALAKTHGFTIDFIPVDKMWFLRKSGHRFVLTGGKFEHCSGLDVELADLFKDKERRRRLPAIVCDQAPQSDPDPATSGFLPYGFWLLGLFAVATLLYRVLIQILWSRSKRGRSLIDLEEIFRP